MVGRTINYRPNTDIWRSLFPKATFPTLLVKRMLMSADRMLGSESTVDIVSCDIRFWQNSFSEVTMLANPVWCKKRNEHFQAALR